MLKKLLKGKKIMIPKSMDDFLKKRIPPAALKNRLIKEEDGRCYLEFSYKDEHLLASLGIIRDKLGPRLVVCMWDEKSDIEIGGYLIIDNLSMGRPSMGGIRMLPNLTPLDIYNLARGMTLKNAAANLPFGGGKSGIIADPELTRDQHEKIIRRFARLLKRYKDLYVPGPDVGTNDADMKLIAIENGIDSAVSKPAEMGGNRIDELGAAAGGVITAFQTLLEIMPRLRILPQFANLDIPEPDQLTVTIQGYGAVGAHASHILKERIPEAKIIGISDIEGYLYCEDGLPINELFSLWKEKRVVTKEYFIDNIIDKGHDYPIKYSSNPNHLLMEDAFCFIPAAPIFNYLGVRRSENPSITVDKMGNWSVIVEGANTYSPDPNRRAMRIRMEQIVYREKGVMIANDYLVNSGGVIFAAQEYLIKTPEHLQIPEEILGNKEAVEKWLEENSEEFNKLSNERLKAGIEHRKKAISNNMVELVDLLTQHPDLLPSIAAEKISVNRLTARESAITAKDIMTPIPTIDVSRSLQEAAFLIISGESNIIAVLSNDKLIGVVTAWDITKSIAEGHCEVGLEEIMTKEVISASPDYTILDIVREFEQYQISAMPIVEDGRVLGVVSSDLIAQQYILEIQKEQK